MNPAILKISPLFAGIAETDYGSLLNCLQAVRRVYEKGETIFYEGATVETVGLICSGAVQLFRDDFTGARHIIAQLTAGDMYGEAFACAGSPHLPMTIAASERSEILQIQYRKILSVCPSSCGFHSRLIENMLSILASKNVLLNQKIDVISRRTTREKLIAYLSAQAKQRGSRDFIIPFNRQELADYLCVERSAMSAELSRMQAQGLIITQKNHFTLIDAGNY